MHFKAIVDRQFYVKINNFQSHWGIELIWIKQYSFQGGYIIRISCPYTPSNNGVVERKIVILVERKIIMLLNMDNLSCSNRSSYVLVGLVLKSVYLISRLPTHLLHHKSPFELLFKITSQYTHLRKFGCQCFPYLKLYNSYKLELRSLPCVLLVYAYQHKGFWCLDLTNHKVYVPSI